jgi:hypothetical protein
VLRCGAKTKVRSGGLQQPRRPTHATGLDRSNQKLSAHQPNTLAYVAVSAPTPPQSSRCPEQHGTFRSRRHIQNRNSTEGMSLTQLIVCCARCCAIIVQLFAIQPCTVVVRDTIVRDSNQKLSAHQPNTLAYVAVSAPAPPQSSKCPLTEQPPSRLQVNGSSIMRTAVSTPTPLAKRLAQCSHALLCYASTPRVLRSFLAWTPESLATTALRLRRHQFKYVYLCSRYKTRRMPIFCMVPRNFAS